MPKATKYVAGYTIDPHKFLDLGDKARHEGFKDLDCTMPYPVHGFEEAYGLKGSWIGLAALGALFTGWAGGFGMQAWMMSVSYPVIVGGKPHVAWPAFIPVTFECGILCAVLTTFLSLVFSSNLRPNPFAAVVKDRMTDDLFSIVIPYVNDEEKSKAEAFLKAQSVDEIEVHDLELLDPRAIRF